MDIPGAIEDKAMPFPSIWLLSGNFILTINITDERFNIRGRIAIVRHTDYRCTTHDKDKPERNNNLWILLAGMAASETGR